MEIELGFRIPALTLDPLSHILICISNYVERLTMFILESGGSGEANIAFAVIGKDFGIRAIR